MNKWRRECYLVEAIARERYADVHLKEHIRKSPSYLVHCTYRGTEYLKVLSMMKTMSEDDIILDEEMNLEFIGLEGFDDLIDNEKWEMLDSSIAYDFPSFTPP